MTPTQRSLLGPVVTTLIRSESDLWSELKQEIGDGYKSIYLCSLEFMQPAERVLKHIGAEDAAALVAEWNRVTKDGVCRTDAEVIGLHSVMVIEEIVKRAKAAVRRE